jgi:predicted amidohydrolase
MTVRVAAAQFYTGTDQQENLDTVLRVITQAAAHRPHILVLPEFCNHASWYTDADHCYHTAIALSLDDPFLKAVSQQAAAHGLYVMLNCTVRRANRRVTGTNILLTPDGSIAATSDKQVLMGNENNFLSRATDVCPIIETPFGRLGMYSCMDGVICETPRGLALRGAQILLNSLNSFALDEASLHVPVRAAENKVFVVAANKVGLLVPDALVPAIAARVGLAAEQLHGAGESQIVAPDGTVLAMAPLRGEAIIWADIDSSQADDKRRPDGQHIFDLRTPRAYAPLARPPASADYVPGAETVTVGVLHRTDLLPAVLRDHRDIALLALPQGDFAATDFLQTLLRDARSDTWIATVIASQQRPFGCLVHADEVIHVASVAEAGGVSVAQLSFGRVALLLGGDTLTPEAFRLCALQRAELVVCPVQVQEAWELPLGFLERAAENRLNVVVASHDQGAGSSAIYSLSRDFTLWTQWERPFDGSISRPHMTCATPGEPLLKGRVHPAYSANRFVSQQTDVVDSRPWWLLDALTQEP